MRGPMDQEIGEARPAAAPAPGAKVLARLHLFNQERGFAAGGAEAYAETAAAATAAESAESQAAQVAQELAPLPEEVAREYGAAATRLAAMAPDRRERGEVAEARLLAGAPESATAASLQASAEAATAPRWRSIGPTRMDNGQTYGDTRISVSGRISAVAIDPGNRDHILAGSGGGGVWRSIDGGVRWTPQTDFAPTLTVGAIAFDPSAPATVYVGTGEGNFYARLGQGVLRSTDRGATFSLLTAAPFVGAGFYDLVVDPADGRRLFAATTSGLWVSTDRGSNWSRRRTARTWEVSIAPAGGAGAEILAACADGLFRSTDGASWTKVNLPAGSPGYDRMGVDHARSDASVAYAFAAAGGAGRLWRRQGGAWQAIAPPGGLSVGQAWYDWFVAAAPDRADQVYLGAIEAWRGDRAGAGWTWTRISNKPGQDIHPDQHAIAFDPIDPNRILIGNDGGLFRSPDRGSAWQSLNDGLAITEIEYIAQDYGSSRWLVGGTQDNGSIRYGGSTVWDHIADGDGGDCGVDRNNPSTVFHTYFGMGMERSTSRGDFGSFQWVGPSVAQGYNALFYPPMEANGTTVAQAGESLFVSRNSGAGWTEIALADVATAMCAPGPDLILVGTDQGRIFRLRWTGASWGTAQALASPRPGAWISDLDASPDGAWIWATSSSIGGGRAFASANGGASWTDRTAGLPGLPINAVQMDPATADRAWVAADLGVYETWNGGQSWAVLGAGLPNVLVADLLFHPHARLLRAGTRNRGVWEIAVDGETPAPVCRTHFTGSVPANSTRRWFTHGWPATWHVAWTVMPTTVRAGAPQLRWRVRAERANAEYVTYWIDVTNLTPHTVAFEGRSAILGRH